tara:strand:+ start:242 stop:529 length:288 start_codon:yes stop_codon:yes gene_type:complete
MTRNNLTKIDFSKNLSIKIGFPISMSKEIIDGLINICSEMIKDNNLVLKNIGTFNLILKNERVGRNPKTKEKYLINKRKSIQFVVSKNLSKILNN